MVLNMFQTYIHSLQSYSTSRNRTGRPRNLHLVTVNNDARKITFVTVRHCNKNVANLTVSQCRPIVCATAVGPCNLLSFGGMNQNRGGDESAVAGELIDDAEKNKQK